MGILLQTATVLIAMMLINRQVDAYSLATHECKSQSDCGPGECCVLATHEYKSRSDCGSGECCVLGMMRYSTAQCMPLGQVDNYCRVENTPENRTLYYPNGLAVDIVDIYTHVCPCGDGLVCEDNFCALQEDTSYENNYLY